MAYNSVRERDPLIDKETQRDLEIFMKAQQ